uniref:Histidine kinase dimerization/phosphoacceptor domain -containing protein n=1 Tax=Roseihalotalea indica TaxID=2867963 RepID=A0AA49GNM2_9BACT|nr:histidine kinase dimerization/phosphoacceptor domain -containing protein [Tunicatimonas sp. TK19036]
MDEVTILIVEDDAIAQLTFLQYLRDLGYEKVVTVNNGYDAVESVQTDPIDLAFLDIRIRGDIDGIATAKLIKERIPFLPLIFLTASTDKHTIHQALDCQPYSIIHKPYDLTILKESIDGALNYKVHQEEVNQLNKQHMLDQILETADVGICVTNAKGEFVKVNRAYCTIYGYSEQELIGKPFTILLPENIRKYAATLHVEYLAGRTEESSGEWKALDKQGNQKDVYITVGRLTDEEGQRFKIATVNDITQRKKDVQKLTQALDEKDTYAREIHHRVKNNMNIMSGLLYLQAEKVKDQEYVHNLFQESISRIKTLSIIHEQLYRHDNYTSIDLKEYIRSLVNNVKSMFRSKAQEIRINQKVASIPLDVDKAIACGLIVNELLSNSFKYAFTEVSSVSCINVNAYPEEETMHIAITDNGIGLPNNFQLERSTTLGFQLISNLSQQLNGTIQISSRNGTRVHLQFPR